MSRARPCPVCGGAPVASFPSLYGARPFVAGVPIELPTRPLIRQCAACGARYVDPEPPVEALAACYREAGAAVWHDDASTEQRRRFAERASRLVALAPTPSVLEVGCYTGAFLASLPSNWERVGVEPSESAAARARERGIVVHTGALETVTLPEAHFGAVVAFDVLEHIVDPEAFVATIAQTLVPGGVLLIETGDTDSRFARLMGRFWSYYHLPEHVVFYNPHAVTTLLDRVGLDVIDVERGRHHKRPDAMLHARRIAIAGAYAALSRGWEAVLRRPAPTRRWQAPWLVHRDHMLVWARRRA